MINKILWYVFSPIFKIKQLQTLKGNVPWSITIITFETLHLFDGNIYNILKKDYI